MAYTDFAYWYDEFNGEANYNALTAQLLNALHKSGVHKGVVVDLGCGTGEVCLRLASAGYDMIGVDSSQDMLSVCREKMMEKSSDEKAPLLLCQKLEELDLFGTVQAAVSTFDTLNHLPQAKLQKALARVALFMEKDGVFIFDANTPYKHEYILGNNTFELESEDVLCLWKNSYNKNTKAVDISVMVSHQGETVWQESFTEYAYTRAEWENMLQQAGFAVQSVQDGELFDELTPQSPRFLFCATKKEQTNAYYSN